MTENDAIERIVSFVCDDGDISEYVHDRAKCTLGGWSPETDEDENDARYEHYWAIVSATAMHLLSGASYRLIRN